MKSKNLTHAAILAALKSLPTFGTIGPSAVALTSDKGERFIVCSQRQVEDGLRMFGAKVGEDGQPDADTFGIWDLVFGDVGVPFLFSYGVPCEVDGIHDGAPMSHIYDVVAAEVIHLVPATLKAGLLPMRKGEQPFESDCLSCGSPDLAVSTRGFVQCRSTACLERFIHDIDERDATQPPASA